MYSLITLFSGAVLALMVACNGALSARYGAFVSAVIIRILGSAFALAACLVRRERIRIRERIPLWLFLGGAIGASTTVLQNLAFRRISMTSIIALGLLGQTLASVLTDSLGLFGMRRLPLRRSQLVSLALALPGMGMMLDKSALSSAPAMLAALGAGAAVVLSRMLNARLAQKTGPLRGSLISQLSGLPFCMLAAWIAAGRILPGSLSLEQPWIYLGGALGAVSVALTNITVFHVSAFHLTALTLTGQMITGAVIDLALGRAAWDASFWGGLAIAAGMLLGMAVQRIGERISE